MPLDPRYVTAVSLDPCLVDKVTGLPLVGGSVYFWQDDNRIFHKPVYELSGAPPNYTYTELPNPMVLGPKGNFVDNTGADVAVYYFPYDDFGNLELYYITVFNAQGVPQFSRQAWPNVTAETAPGEPGNNDLTNVVVNSQFGFINFPTTQTITIAGVVANQVYNVAPGWQLIVSSTGAGSVVLTQIPQVGTANLPGQPPYSLRVTGSMNISSLILQQSYVGNPNIFSRDVNGNGGWVNTSILVAPNSGLSINYAPNNALPVQNLITVPVNLSGVFAEYNNEVQLTAGTNAASGNASSTNIQIVLNPTGTTEFTNVQIIPSYDELDDNPVYNQVPLSTQQGELLGFYEPLLAYKPIPSYLVGWDFPLNPAQMNGPMVAAFAGANEGQYAWDQTIIYQTVTNSVGVARGTNGGLQLTAEANGQIAIIQYLDQVEARKILSDRSSVHLSLFGTFAAGTLAGNVTLWATTNANAPALPTTLISTFGANGIPTASAAGWTQVPNVYSNTSFTVSAASSTNSESADINLNGWDLAGAAPANSAMYFAIVVGFAAWANGDIMNVNSIALCPGDIATRPAPKTAGQTLIDCNKYYWKTFQLATKPATQATLNTGEYRFSAIQANVGNNYSSSIVFPAPMLLTPAITFYNPVNNNAAAYDVTTTADSGVADTTGCNLSANSFNFHVPTVGGGSPTAAGDRLAVHITASARIGIET